MHIVPNRINLIDISSVQGDVDFRKVKDAGFEGVYIQSSRYSSTRELRYSKYRDQALSAGLKVGAYHFCSHDSDAIKQAEHFCKSAGGHGQNKNELPPMIDWEFCTPRNYKDHPNHCVQWILKMAKAVEKLWYPDNESRLFPRKPTIYSYPVYCTTHQPALKQTTELGVFPLTYASYAPKAVLPPEDHQTYHPVPKPWSRALLTQYSGNVGVPVPGVNGPCDRILFNGSSADWDRFLGIRKPHHKVEGYNNV